MSKPASIAFSVLFAIFGGLTPATAQRATSDVPAVKIDTGSVSGVTANGVTSFKGIPYAAPPVGALRWRMPQPAKSWPGVLAADKFAPSCMQTEDIPKSEEIA